MLWRPFSPGVFPWMLLCCLAANDTSAQVAPADSILVIGEIRVAGNRRTREDIVLRELDIRLGDSLYAHELEDCLLRNEQRLMNTNLFLSARLGIHAWDGATGRIGLTIRLREAWYLYPIPIFELADRNFNVWWDEYAHSLQRINYGLKLYHFNLSGRNDEVKLTLQHGYTQKFELRYTLPTLGNGIDWGMRLHLLAARNKEIAWTSLDDKQQFFRSEDDFLLHRLRAVLGLRRRYGNDFFAELSASYYRHRVHPFVLDSLNPRFLPKGPVERYLALSFQAVWDTRDVRPFPTKGHYLALGLRKEGLGLFAERRNRLLVSALLKHYTVLATRWSVEWVWKGQADLARGPKPFYLYRALGYGSDFLRGYEYYVIDGKDFAYAKHTLRWIVFDRKIDWGALAFLEAFRVMPLRIYLSLHTDLGYVHDPWYAEGNTLRNRLLWSHGVGIHFLAYYNKRITLEWSRNASGENGLFLHWKFRF